MTLVDVESVGPDGAIGVHHRLQVTRTKRRKKLSVTPRCEHSDAERVLAVLADVSLGCEWVARFLKHFLDYEIPLEEARVWAGLSIDPVEAILTAHQSGGGWTFTDVYRWQAGRVAQARAALQNTAPDADKES
jgi:hypothetical protein